MKEITMKNGKVFVDGVEYVKKIKAIESTESNEIGLGGEFVGDYVIIRSKSAGVFAGTLQNIVKDEATLKDTRWLWYWDGAASLDELALRGVSKPQNCKFPNEIPLRVVKEVIEIIPCAEEAIKSIKNVPVWTAHNLDE